MYDLEESLDHLETTILGWTRTVPPYHPNSFALIPPRGICWALAFWKSFMMAFWKSFTILDEDCMSEWHETFHESISKTVHLDMHVNHHEWTCIISKTVLSLDILRLHVLRRMPCGDTSLRVSAYCCNQPLERLRWSREKRSIRNSAGLR